MRRPDEARRNYGDTLLFPQFIDFRPFAPPSPTRPQRAAQLRFETIEKLRRAERAADRLSRADGGEFLRGRSGFEQIGEASGGAIEQRRDADKFVVAPAQMRAYARPRPVARPPHQPRPQRIERDIARRRDEMRFVERHGAEAALKQMPGDAQTRVDEAGVPAVRFAERQRQTIRGIGHQDEMDVVGHQAIRPHRDAGLAATLGQQIAVKRIVAILEENLLPPVATLGDMMRQTGHDDAGEAGHQHL